MTSDEDQREEYYTEMSDQPVHKKQKSIYKAKKGDEVDEAMEMVLNKFNFNLPVIRITDGKYLIGTETKMVMLRNSTCMVRVGGGFERMEDYIARNQDSELDKIRKMMSENGKTYDQVIVELLQKYGAEQAVINHVQKNVKNMISDKLKSLKASSKNTATRDTEPKAD